MCCTLTENAGSDCEDFLESPESWSLGEVEMAPESSRLGGPRCSPLGVGLDFREGL